MKFAFWIRTIFKYPVSLPCPMKRGQRLTTSVACNGCVVINLLSLVPALVLASQPPQFYSIPKTACSTGVERFYVHEQLVPVASVRKVRVRHSTCPCVRCFLRLRRILSSRHSSLCILPAFGWLDQIPRETAQTRKEHPNRAGVPPSMALANTATTGPCEFVFTPVEVRKFE